LGERKLTRKAMEIGLSFPYDWSNPNISDFALIWKVLEHEIFEDVMRVCWYFGMDAVQEVHRQMPCNNIRDQILARMLDNIQTGFNAAKGMEIVC